jgi:hypothetical protein
MSNCGGEILLTVLRRFCLEMGIRRAEGGGKTTRDRVDDPQHDAYGVGRLRDVSWLPARGHVSKLLSHTRRLAHPLGDFSWMAALSPPKKCSWSRSPGGTDARLISRHLHREARTLVARLMLDCRAARVCSKQEAESPGPNRQPEWRTDSLAVENGLANGAAPSSVRGVAYFGTSESS